MRQGTTPKHTFTLPFVIPEGSVVRVIYAQKPGGINKVLFVKTGELCEVCDNVVITRLTQDDTLLFDDDLSALVQVRVLTPDGEAVTSDVITVAVEECLDTCVMCFEEEME